MGGFTGANVTPRLQELIELVGSQDFCIDAKSGVRDKISSAYGDDVLNVAKVREYLQSSAKVLE